MSDSREEQMAKPGELCAGPLAEFLRYIKDARQLSPHTVAAYQRDLRDFSQFLIVRAEGKDWDWTSVDRLTLRAYLGHLASKRFARRTIARKLSAIRSFFRY